MRQTPTFTCFTDQVATPEPPSVDCGHIGRLTLDRLGGVAEITTAPAAFVAAVMAVASSTPRASRSHPYARSSPARVWFSLLARLNRRGVSHAELEIRHVSGDR